MRSLLPAAFLLALVFLVGGCATRTVYSKISFAYTSEHRMPPPERIITLDASPQTAALAVRKWVENENGKILGFEDDHEYTYRLLPDAMQNYAAVQEITRKEWKAYDDNDFREWTDEEWERFRTLSTTQVARSNSSQPGYAITARLGDRDGTYNYRVQSGTTMGFGYNPGVPGMVPAYTYSYPVPKYESKTKTVPFYSQLEIYIFNDGGKTGVYAIGYPVEADKDIRANYGNSIGHAYWKSVDGTHEVAFIKQLFAFLKGNNLDIYTSGESLSAD